MNPRHQSSDPAGRRSLWYRLTEPSPVLTRVDDRRNAQLLRGILIALIIIAGAVLAGEALQNREVFDDFDFILTTGLWVSCFGLYVLAGGRHYRSVAAAFTAMLFILFTVVPYTPSSLTALPFYIVVPILFTSMFFSVRWLLIVSAASVLVPVVMLLLVMPLGYNQTRGSIELITFTILVSGVILVHLAHRKAIETLRIEELQAAYDRVRSSEIELERRIEERTRQLRASELNWRTLTINSPDAIIRITPDRKISFFQHPLLTVEGNEEALLGYPILDLYLPETRQTVSDAIDRTFATGELQEVEVPGILDLAAGTRALYQNRIIPLRSEGKITGAMIVATDITQRSRMQESLRSLERAVSHGAAAIVILDATQSPELPIIYINDAVTAITGYAREDFIGKDGRFLFPPVRSAPGFNELRAAFQERRSCNVVLPAIRKDGASFWGETWLSPVADDSGTVTHFVATMVDVTARIEAEQRQASLLEQLETSNRDLKDFAYIVSHDLKAPLRGIGSVATWLSMDYADQLDEDGRKLLTILTGRVQRMDALISGILEYSRIGRTQEALEQVHTGWLVSEIVEEIVPPERFQVTIAPDMPSLLAEPTRLRQVFQNLIANAVSYMDKPAGQIRIGFEDRPSELCFSVSDNGPGIEERFFSRVFLIFQTLASRDERESTGIGLAIVKRSVENWGGTVSLESTVGKGSTFSFTIPKPESR